MTRSGVNCDADLKPERFQTARAFLFSADLPDQEDRRAGEAKTHERIMKRRRHIRRNVLARTDRVSRDQWLEVTVSNPIGTFKLNEYQPSCFHY